MWNALELCEGCVRRVVEALGCELEVPKSANLQCEIKLTALKWQAWDVDRQQIPMVHLAAWRVAAAQDQDV